MTVTAERCTIRLSFPPLLFWSLVFSDVTSASRCLLTSGSLALWLSDFLSLWTDFSVSLAGHLLALYLVVVTEDFLELGVAAHASLPCHPGEQGLLTRG